MQLVSLLYVTSNQKHIIFFFCDLCHGSHPISSAVQNLLQVDGQGLKVFFNTNTQKSQIISNAHCNSKPLGFF